MQTKKPKCFIHSPELQSEYHKCGGICCFFSLAFYTLFYTTTSLLSYSAVKPTVNLGVWMPANHHMASSQIHMIGRFSLGRFGWFTPKVLAKNNQIHAPMIPYTIFKTNTGEQFNRFLFDTTVLKELLVPFLLFFSDISNADS